MIIVSVVAFVVVSCGCSDVSVVFVVDVLVVVSTGGLGHVTSVVSRRHPILTMSLATSTWCSCCNDSRLTSPVYCKRHK